MRQQGSLRCSSVRLRSRLTRSPHQSAGPSPPLLPPPLRCCQVAPTDIEEGMRVGVDRQKYQIQIPLPPKIDASVTMMTVEEKPDVTYR